MGHVCVWILILYAAISLGRHVGDSGQVDKIQRFPKQANTKTYLTTPVEKAKRRKFKYIRKIKAYIKRYYTPKQYENQVEGKKETQVLAQGLKPKYWNTKNKGKSKETNRLQSCITLPCLNDMGLVLHTEMTIVSNFLSQEKIIQNRVILLDQKRAKAGSRWNTALELEKTLGPSAAHSSIGPICAETFNSSLGLKASTIAMELEACNSTISSACDFQQTFNDTTKKQLADCKTVINNFADSAALCQDSMTCNCWSAASLRVQEVKDCNIAIVIDRSLRKSVFKCKESFIKCSKQEDASLEYLVKCYTSQTSLKKRIQEMKTTMNMISKLVFKIDSLIANKKSKTRFEAMTCSNFMLKLEALNFASTTNNPSSQSTFTNSMSSILDVTVTECTKTEQVTLQEIKQSGNLMFEKMNRSYLMYQNMLFMLSEKKEVIEQPKTTTIEIPEKTSTQLSTSKTTPQKDKPTASSSESITMTSTKTTTKSTTTTTAKPNMISSSITKETTDSLEKTSNSKSSQVSTSTGKKLSTTNTKPIHLTPATKYITSYTGASVSAAPSSKSQPSTFTTKSGVTSTQLITSTLKPTPSTAESSSKSKSSTFTTTTKRLTSSTLSPLSAKSSTIKDTMSISNTTTTTLNTHTSTKQLPTKTSNSKSSQVSTSTGKKLSTTNTNSKSSTFTTTTKRLTSSTHQPLSAKSSTIKDTMSISNTATTTLNTHTATKQVPTKTISSTKPFTFQSTKATTLTTFTTQGTALADKTITSQAVKETSQARPSVSTSTATTASTGTPGAPSSSIMLNPLPLYLGQSPLALPFGRKSLQIPSGVKAKGIPKPLNIIQQGINERQLLSGRHATQLLVGFQPAKIKYLTIVAGPNKAATKVIVKDKLLNTRKKAPLPFVVNVQRRKPCVISYFKDSQ